MSPNKRLVFHFYVDNNFFLNKVAKLHLLLLEEFTSLFEEAVVVVSYDKETTQETIEAAKTAIFKAIKANTITIKIIENSPLREAKTFFDEIVEKKQSESTPEIVFFGHSKGYSNEINDSLIDWIIGLYYLSLKFADEAINSLLWNTENQNALFFGSFLLIENFEFELFSDSVYSGTFFWINRSLLLNEIKFMPPLDNRFYAEKFPYRASRLTKNFVKNKCNGHRAYGTIHQFYDFYGKHRKGEQDETIHALKNILSESEFMDYLNFKKSILDKLKAN